MKHYYERIDGWFDWQDLYATWVREVPAGGVIVEIGSFKGRSAAFLGVEVATSGKALQVICIDPFTGQDHDRILEGAGPDLAREFAHNLAPVSEALGTDFVVLQERSEVAAARFADGSLDRVYIDGDHAPHQVLQDLDAYWPKVAPGGEMAGHDLDWPSVADTVDAWATSKGLVIEVLEPRTWRIRKPVPSLDFLVPARQRSLLVVPMTYFSHLSVGAAESLLGVCWGPRVQEAMQAHGFDRIDLYWERSLPEVADMRDHAALVARIQKFTHLLFLDVDMRWPADLLQRILAHHDKGIVSGLYFQRGGNFMPVALHRVDEPEDALETVPSYAPAIEVVRAEGLQPVDAVGMGCCLIPTAVFDLWERPWFWTRRNKRGYHNTEDMQFCEAALAKGVPIYVDPSIECGHEFSGLATKHTHLTSLQRMRRELAEARQEVGKA